MNAGAVTTMISTIAPGGAGQLLGAPSDGGDMTSTSVTPGVGAFVVIFLLAAVIALLALDMTRRVRRIQARTRAEERLARERAEDDQEQVRQDGTERSGPESEHRRGSEDRPDDGQGPSEPGEDTGGSSELPSPGPRSDR